MPRLGVWASQRSLSRRASRPEKRLEVAAADSVATVCSEGEGWKLARPDRAPDRALVNVQLASSLLHMQQL
jgi:hypothetical protein